MSQSTQSLRRGAAKFILATPPLRKAFLRLALDENLLMRILEDPIFTYRVLEVKPVAGRMANVLDHPKLFEHYLTSNRVHDRLLSNEAFLDRLSEEDALIAKLAKNGGALTRLARDPEVAAALIEWPEFADAAASDMKFVARILSGPNTVNAILADAKLLDRLIGDKRLFAHIAGVPGLLKDLLHSPEVVEFILDDEVLVGRFVEDHRLAAKGVTSPAMVEARLSNRQALLQVLMDDRAIDEIASTPAVANAIFENERIVGLIATNEKLLAKVMQRWAGHPAAASDEIVGAFARNRDFVRALLSSDRAIAAIAAEDGIAVSLLSDRRVVRRIVSDAVAINGILFEPRARDAILADPRLIGLLLRDERGVSSLLRDPVLLKRIVSRGEVIDAVLTSPSASKALFEDRRSIDAIVSNAELIGRILHRGPVVEYIARDEHLLTHAVKQAGPAFADSILLSTGADQRFVRKAKVLIEFDENWSHFAPSAAAAPNLAERVALAREHLKKVEDIPDAILDLLADGDHIPLPGARLEFPDRRSLWVVLNEILIEEEYFFETKSTSPRILDCGTHFGMALYYFKRLYPDSRITAFEPLPRMFSMAQRNIESNAMRGVELLPYALSDHDGETTFHISESDSMAGSLTERRRELGDHLVPVKVQCRKLSAWLDEPVHFLKVDIEGSEDVVLAEAAPKLQNVQHIFCEYHHGAGLEPARLPKLLSILNGAGFDVMIGPSYAYAQTSRRRGMRHTGLSYSLVLWARNRNWS